jgi:hypothetical protein
MKKIKLYKYYRFGFNYNILLRDSADITNKELLKRLDEYLQFVDELNLSVTRGGFELNGLKRLYDRVKKAADDPKSAEEIVDSKELKKLEGGLKIVDHVLDAELWIKVGFLLDEKRYSNETLTSNIERLFADDVYTTLPVIAQDDFRESGMCLAFDRYTAVAFHALRGTEEVLKLYYSKLLGKIPGPKATWGTYLTAINKRILSKGISPSPSPELMINLESLREYHRNKTQHPVRTYTRDEAQDLLGMCAKTINEIISDLLKRKLL